jgi:hypothetical protein
MSGVALRRLAQEAPKLARGFKSAKPVLDAGHVSTRVAVLLIVRKFRTVWFIVCMLGNKPREPVVAQALMCWVA